MDECKIRAPGSLEWEKNQLETDSHSVDENEGCKAAWNILKPQLAPANWSVGESSTYYGFFSWGWEARGQYEAPTPPEVSQDEVKRISDMPQVCEAMANFAQDVTGDNGEEVIRVILGAIKATPPEVEPVGKVHANEVSYSVELFEAYENLPDGTKLYTRPKADKH